MCGMFVLVVNLVMLWFRGVVRPSRAYGISWGLFVCIFSIGMLVLGRIFCRDVCLE